MVLDRRAGRALAGIAVLAYAVSFLGWLSGVVLRPQLLWTTVDLHTYYDAVRTLAHSQHRIYRQQFGPWPGPFLYPPFAAYVIAKASTLGLGSLRILVAALSHLSLLWPAASTWRLLGRRSGPERTAAVFGLAALGLWLDPVEKTLYFGQVSLLLFAAGAAGYLRGLSIPLTGRIAEQRQRG